MFILTLAVIRSLRDADEHHSQRGKVNKLWFIDWPMAGRRENCKKPFHPGLFGKKEKGKNTGVAIFRNSSLLPWSILNLENILTYRKTHRTDLNWLHLDFGGKTSWPHKPMEHFVWKGWLQQLLLTSQNRKIYFIFHFSSPPSYNLRRRASFFSVYLDANTYSK